MSKVTVLESGRYWQYELEVKRAEYRRPQAISFQWVADLTYITCTLLGHPDMHSFIRYMTDDNVS
jgi:hypothetical protein